MKKYITMLMLSIALGGCTTGELVRGGLHEGMNKADVIALLGNPDGYKKAGDQEALLYTNKLISGWSWDRTDYTVILKDGLVSEYGNGQVRQKSPNTLVIVPLTY